MTDGKQRESEVSVEPTANPAVAAAAVNHGKDETEDGARDTFGDWLEGGGDADDDDDEDGDRR